MKAPLVESAADLIDLELAARIARRALERLAPLPTAVQARLDDEFVSSTALAYERVAAATGLRAPEGGPRALVVDRLGWAEANVASLAELLGRLDPPTSARGAMTHAVGRASSGTQLGLMFSWLARRVLGQYDMVTGDPERDAVYYVGRNVLGLELKHGFAPSEFRLWIALHEVTHHLQFAAVPWMREYFFDLVSRAASFGNVSQQGMSEALSRAFETVRRGENPLAEGGIAAMLAGPELLETLREAQALMSLLEGHAEFVMSRTAPDLVPGSSRFAAVLRKRRAQASPVARFVQQALGFEAKLRQYHEGFAFIEAVDRAGGDDLVSRLWTERSHLPVLAEIHAPERWIERVTGDGQAGGRRAVP